MTAPNLRAEAVSELPGHIRVSYTHPVTGTGRTIIVEATMEEFTLWQMGELIQVAMPRASDDHREQMISGFSADEFDALFAEDPA